MTKRKFDPVSGQIFGSTYALCGGGRAKRINGRHEGEWAAFSKDFDDTMAKFNVPEAERNELFAIVESTKGDIVCG